MKDEETKQLAFDVAQAEISQPNIILALPYTPYLRLKAVNPAIKMCWNCFNGFLGEERFCNLRCKEDYTRRVVERGRE